MKTSYIIGIIVVVIIIVGGVYWYSTMKSEPMAADTSAMPADAMPATTTTTTTTTQQGVLVGGAYMVPNLNIVQNALNADNVTTLVAAVKAAGLVDTLEGPGPFTVFAPTNDAFNRNG
jgi:uncharacterized surface protein with fasciclin (FAS1) repeats